MIKHNHTGPLGQLGRILPLACAVLLLAAPHVVAGTGDGTVIGATKVLDNGPDNERFNIVVLAEGYTLAEQVDFDYDVQQLVDDLFLYSPFDSMAAAINMTKINVASDESGADDPTECGGTGAVVATYFDATFCSGGIRRALVVNNSICYTVLNTYVPNWDVGVVLVNSNVYGGTGGGIATTSVTGSWPSVVVHELGHSSFGLADEYESLPGCGSDGDEWNNHPPYEPGAPNVTIQTVRELVKWNHLIEPATPIPTTENANCDYCDNQWYPLDEFTVGTYEGADYYHCDCYRPQFWCMMRDRTEYFCAVCQVEAEATFAPFMPPAFEAYPRGGPEALTVDFTYASPLPATAWTWYFGDGDSSQVENPSHTYGPGAFNVELHVATDLGERIAFEEGYITVWADTLTAPEKEALPGAAGYWEINLANAVPIHEMTLPIRMTNVTSVLFFDSLSFVGTRVADFESKQVVFDSRFTGDLAVRLRADVGGGTPSLPPGSGPVARAHYRVRTNAAPGDTSYVSTATLGSHSFKAMTYDTSFIPVSNGATFRVVSACACPSQGDIEPDEFITALDLGACIDILFAGAEDVQDASCPSPRFDLDCDEFSTALDLSVLIDHLFAGGAGPCDPCAL
jgi:PKD repeat protein